MDQKEIPQDDPNRDTETMSLASFEQKAAQLTASLRARAEQSKKSGDALVAEARRIAKDLDKKGKRIDARIRQQRLGMIIGAVAGTVVTSTLTLWDCLKSAIKWPKKALGEFSAWRRHRRTDRLIQMLEREAERKNRGDRTS